MKIYKSVKGNTKEDYKQAIIDICKCLEQKADDILVDFDKDLRSVQILLNIEYGSISIIEVKKEYTVSSEE